MSVRGKGHLHICIAGRKDNLRGSILRKENTKTLIKISVNQKVLWIVQKFVRKLGNSVRKLGNSVRKLGKSV